MLLPLLIACGVAAPGWTPFRQQQQRGGPAALLRSKADAIMMEAASIMESSGPSERGKPNSPSWFDVFMVDPNATRLERKDWGRDLGAAFENFRIPAALVAGSALSGAFALPPLQSDALLHAVLRRLYLSEYLWIFELAPHWLSA